MCTSVPEHYIVSYEINCEIVVRLNEEIFHFGPPLKSFYGWLLLDHEPINFLVVGVGVVGV